MSEKLSNSSIQDQEKINDLVKQEANLCMSPMKRRRNECPISEHIITLANGTKKCNFESCSQTWRSSTANSTISNHLEKIHSIKTSSQNSESQNIQQSVSKKHNQLEQDKRNKALIEFIIESFQSFSTVNSRAFLNFCYLLDSCFTVPDENTISLLVDREYENSMLKLKALINSLESSVNLSIDVWTSLTNESYMTVNCLFIDNDWVKRKFVLDFFQLPPNYNDEQIFEFLKKTLNEYGIEQRVLSITTDNSAKMTHGVGYLKSDQKNLSIFNMRCSKQILNQVLLDSLNSSEIRYLTTKIKKICQKIDDSPKLCADLLAYQKTFKEKELPVLISNENKYESIFDMLERAILMKQSLIAISNELNKVKSNRDIYLDAENFIDASLILDLLEPFKQSLLDLNDYDSSICLYPIFDQLIKHLEKRIRDKDFDDFYDTIESMQEKLNNYWRLIRPTALICSILDPRFKKEFLDEYDTKTGVKLLEDLIKDYRKKYPSGEVDSKNVTKSETSLSMIDRLLQSKNVVFDSESSPELVQYLNSSKIENVPGFDVIKWWSNSNLKYLKLIAKDYLYISPSIVQPEKNFTSARLTTNDRTAFDFEPVRKLTCLNSWLNKI